MSQRNKEDFKHLEFDRYDPNRPAPRKKRGYGRGPKKKDNVEHGNKLLEDLEEVIEENERNKDIYPPELKPELVFIVKQEKEYNEEKEKEEIFEISEEEFNRSGIEILEKEGDEWLIVFSTEKHASSFKERLEKYRLDLSYKERGNKNPKYARIFSNIEDIIPRYPENRMDKNLRAFYDKGEMPENKVLVRIDFWWLGKNITKEKVDVCENLLEENDSEIVSSYYKFGMASIIAKINIDSLKIVSRMSEIYYIQKIDQLDSEARDLKKITIENIPTIKLSEIKKKPYVCILDTGVAEGHPIIEGTVEKNLIKCTDTDIPYDQDGHGTHLVGTLLYGDLEKKLDKRELVPSARLLSVKIAKTFVKKNISDFNDKIIESIEEIYENYGCKIFVLTFLPTINPLKPKTKIRKHQLSILLDRLINKLNIIVICPIGNINYQKYGYINANDLENGKYTKFMFENKILEGASANSVLTIGSIAGKETYPSNNSSLDIASLKILSKKEDPSIFSRTGPGLGKCIKPDLIALGGNKLYYAESSIPFITLESSSMYGPKYDAVVSDLFTYDSGTCLSACMTANHIANFMEKYPGHTGNFYRAFLSNRSKPFEPSSGFLRNNDLEDSTKKKKFLNMSGFGIVNNKELYFGNAKTISVYYEGEIPLDEIHYFEIPIPDSFKNINDDRGVTITLAYNPPVVPRKGYRGVNMEFRYVYENMSKGEIYNHFTDIESIEDNDNKVIGDEEFDVKSESQYNFEYDYSSKVRKKSTLKTARYIWNKFSDRVWQSTREDMENNKHYLLVYCKKKSWFIPIKDKQTYALIVTIWHKSSNQIYEQVNQKVRVPVRLNP